MTPYELGILAAQRRNVSGHLKQAYARGFAGVMEKRAELSDNTKRILAGLLIGGGTGAAVSAADALFTPAGNRKPDETPDAHRRRVALRILKGLGIGAGFGGSLGGLRAAYRTATHSTIPDRTVDAPNGIRLLPDGSGYEMRD